MDVRPDRRLLLYFAALVGPVLLTPPIGMAGFGHLSLDTAQTSFLGEGNNEQAGWAIAFAGDHNADGYDDLLIGAQLNDDGAQDAGKAYLLFGGPNGFGGGIFDLSGADGAYIGERSEDYAGSALAGVGDVDGDGYDDFLIGAWANDQAGGTSGKTYLYFGGPAAPGTHSLANADVAFTGEAAGDISGYALAPAGDVNADGYADFLIGAPDNDAAGSNAGRVYLWLGSPSRPTGTHPLQEAPAIFQGSTANDLFGFAVAGGSDVDGDHRGDLLIGAYRSSLAGAQTGAAYLFTGSSVTSGIQPASSATLVVTGVSTGDQLGYSLALPGDVDGDGVSDLLIGAYRASEYKSGSGAGILLSGRFALTSQTISADEGVPIYGDAPYDQAGQVVAAAGDVNRDGLADLLIGAPYTDLEGQSDVGQVAFVAGSRSLASSTFSSLPDLFVGYLTSGLAGFSIAGRGDVDGDGHPDVLIGAAQAGHAYLILSGLYFDDDGDGQTELEGDCDDGDPSAAAGQAEVPYDGIDQDCDGEDLADVDGDGFLSSQSGGTDCDDHDSTISPSATESADGIDNDCDGVIDNDTAYGDDDHDGFSELEGDCDDAASGVYPGATEQANGQDDDCNGRIDDGLVTSDDDGDGISVAQGDCDDHDDAIYPGALEIPDGRDQDCDGSIDEMPFPGDRDGDGFTTADGDPDDGNPTVYPGATELPDGLDNDGDGQIDEGAVDLDGDGYSPAQGDADDHDPSVYPGSTGAGTSTSGTGSSPYGSGTGTSISGTGSSPYGSGTGTSNSGTGSSPYGSGTGTSISGTGSSPYGSGTASQGSGTDTSTSGTGTPTSGTGTLTSGSGTPTSGSGAPTSGSGTPASGSGSTSGTGTSSSGQSPDQDLDGDGYSPAQGDCDDHDANVNPATSETINGRDDDCNGRTDEHSIVYDDDGDGFSELDDDCADQDALRYPGAHELCDQIDNDCDGEIDEGCAAPGEDEQGGDDDTGQIDSDDDDSSSTAGAGDDDAGSPDDDDTGKGDDVEPGDDDANPGDDDTSWSGDSGDGDPPTEDDEAAGNGASRDEEEPEDPDEIRSWGDTGTSDYQPFKGHPFYAEDLNCGCTIESGTSHGSSPSAHLFLLLFGVRTLRLRGLRRR